MSKINKLELEPEDHRDKKWEITHSFFGMVSEKMKEEGMNKSDLAEKLDVSKPHITQLLEGKPNVTIKKMAKIAGAVGLDLKITSEEIDILKDEYYLKFKDEKCAECFLNTEKEENIKVYNRYNLEEEAVDKDGEYYDQNYKIKVSSNMQMNKA